MFSAVLFSCAHSCDALCSTLYYLLFVQVDELCLDATERRFAQRWIDIDIHRVHQSISIARNACGKRVLDLLQAFQPVLARAVDR